MITKTPSMAKWHPHPMAKEKKAFANSIFEGYLFTRIPAARTSAKGHIHR